jgi:hypothetical protein
MAVAYCHPYVYVLGGRGYQSDDLALLSTCEKFNLNTYEWEMMASMNEKKCST